MSKDVLGADGLAALAGPMKDFYEKLAGANGLEWFVAFKKFLRRENPWSTEVRWHLIDNNTIEVNLDAQVKLPFEGAEVAWPTKVDPIVKTVSG
ncbi:hypothetical protein HY734_03115 [Candidatus Uhrbacteria bacterium]|nr:hypothetical protein [Candidatus Uhrbacteria bacterium]